MAFDQSTRNRLQKFVNDARNLLTEEFNRQLQATYGLDPKAGSVAAVDSLTHLDNRQRQTANVLRDTLAHYLATTHGKGEKDRTKQALSRIVREQAFTVLNRLAALRMAEARGFLLETIAKGYNAKGFQLYKQLAGSSLGETGEAYRNYLYNVFDEFSLDLAVLFDRHSAQGRLFPRESALLELLDLINHHEIEPLWAEDETIGWIYQYFNSQEERKKMRAESQTPRNSRELAVRNQFFTPRYVVEFLTDNTLGRIWYEMTQGKTSLIDSCRYLVRRPTEVFLKPGELAPEREKAAGEAEALSQEELLKQPVYIPHRAIKDPRCIRMLDPACGSMHFGLYAFDLYERIYEEAWQLEAELGAEAFVREGDLKPLHQTYESFEDFKAEIPRLIIEHNIHGVDIDPRAVQIAGLSLWQRAQRAWQQQGIKPQQRPVVRKSNIVCAEPMPGEKALLQEFSSTLNPPVLGQLLEAIFDKMELAGEAGTLLKIEEEIQSSIHQARGQWQARSGANSVGDMFQAELDQATPQKELGFDLGGVDDESFWDGAEQLILDALSNYADKAASNADQKRLFAEDAAKGFAFIDLCRKRFDVVLMNPPFGDIAGPSEKYISKIYPNHCNNIISPFITRAGILLIERGRSGAIFDKTVSIKSSYSKIRNEYLFGDHALLLSSDLGWGVLDQAQVETVVNVFSKHTKENYIDNVLIDKNIRCSKVRNSFILGNIEKIPNFALSLEIPQAILNLFGRFESLEPACCFARQGLGISDSWRWYRTKAETPIGEIGDKANYAWLANGGGFSPFFRDSDLTIFWRNNGEAIKQVEAAIYGSASRTVKNVDFYFKEGLSFPKRTETLNAHALPSGHIFSVEGLGCFPVPGRDMWHALALLNSKLLGYLINTFCGQHKHVGYVKQLPYSEENSRELSNLAKAAFLIKRTVSEYFANTAFYRGPALLYVEELSNRLDFKIEKTKTIEGRSLAVLSVIDQANSKLEAIMSEIDDLVFRSYGLDQETISYISQNVSKTDSSIVAGITKNQDLKSQLLSDVLDFIVGLEFGRYAKEVSVIENDQIYVSPPPNIAPSVRQSNSQKIIEIDALVGGSLEVSSFEQIENELCAKAGEIESYLTDYYDVNNIQVVLSNPSIYFDAHFNTYSKTRRSSPIFWPFQTPSGSYTLWVYYHQLNEQILYTCVNDFVEPKLALVERDLNSLRGNSARSTQEEKELEKLSDHSIELRDFRDEILRIAKFWKPNLNDGVQITAAPLWKLFQHKAWQKKLKETWEKLEKGDYDWAHLAGNIWPERVLRKCHQDRSLAIAHDVENTFWHEVEVPVMRGKKATGQTKLEWQPKELTDNELDALIQAKIKERRA